MHRQISTILENMFLKSTKLHIILSELLTLLFLYSNICRNLIWRYMHLEREGFFLIARIKQVGDRILKRIIAKKNIDMFNGAQGRILYVLWKRDGIPIKELAKQTGLAMSSLTRPHKSFCF